MIVLTRLNGAQFALNPDLIERVDRTPDTVITLVDGTKYLVRESLDEVISAVLDYRAQVLAAAGAFDIDVSLTRRSRLAAVPPPTQPASPRQPAGANQPTSRRQPGSTENGSDVPVLPLNPRQA